MMPLDQRSVNRCELPIGRLRGVRRPGAALASIMPDQDQSGAGPPHSKETPELKVYFTDGGDLRKSRRGLKDRGGCNAPRDGARVARAVHVAPATARKAPHRESVATTLLHSAVAHQVLRWDHVSVPQFYVSRLVRASVARAQSLPEFLSSHPLRLASPQ